MASGKFKAYRGSASQESYVVQNKEASGGHQKDGQLLIPYKGPVFTNFE